MVDAGLLVTPQDSTDSLGDLPRRRRALRSNSVKIARICATVTAGVFPPSARAPGSGTTRPVVPA